MTIHHRRSSMINKRKTSFVVLIKTFHITLPHILTSECPRDQNSSDVTHSHICTPNDSWLGVGGCKFDSGSILSCTHRSGCVLADGVNAALLHSNKRNVSPEQVHSTVVPRPVKMSVSHSAQENPAHGAKRHDSVLQVPDINTAQCILHGISTAVYLGPQYGVHRKSDANCRRSS